MGKSPGKSVLCIQHQCAQIYRIFPFYLFYGRQARIPIDLVYNTPEPSNQSHGEYGRKLCQSLERAYSSAREKLQTAAQHQKTNYDQGIHGEPFEVGDLVYLLSPMAGLGN